MPGFRRSLALGLFAIALGAGTMVTGSSTASADVACNRYGECWHVQEHYTYPHHLGIRIYGDDWREAHRHDRHYHWLKDRDQSGYYSHGQWHPLD